MAVRRPGCASARLCAGGPHESLYSAFDCTLRPSIKPSRCCRAQTCCHAIKHIWQGAEPCEPQHHANVKNNPLDGDHPPRQLHRSRIQPRLSPVLQQPCLCAAACKLQKSSTSTLPLRAPVPVPAPGLVDGMLPLLLLLVPLPPSQQSIPTADGEEPSVDTADAAGEAERLRSLEAGVAEASGSGETALAAAAMDSGKL